MDINNVDELIVSINDLDTEQIPPWANIIIQGMKVLSVQLQTLSKVSERIQKLEDFKIINETVTTKLHEDNERLNELVEELQIKLDDQEQRSRNQCLLFHGIDEKEGNVKENTDNLVIDIIKSKLQINDFSLVDIQRSHRLGPKKPGRNLRSTQDIKRPIIVRFASWRVRNKVFKTKKELKGSKISITEKLTRYRHQLYKAAMNKYGVKNTWTSEGHVLVKKDDNKIESIESMDDI